MSTTIKENVQSIKHQPAGLFEETRFEKIHNVIFSDSVAASIAVAHEIADLIRSKQAKGKKCVLGLATGSSPIKVYEELVRLKIFYRKNGCADSYIGRNQRNSIFFGSAFSRKSCRNSA